MPCGEVLVEHAEVVAKVEVALPRAPHLERGPSEMVDDAVGGVKNTTACKPKPPRQIDLLHVSEEALVKASYPPERLATDEVAGACRPEYLALIVILPVIQLDSVEETTPTEGIAPTI